MINKKSSYLGYSEEEVKDLESNYFCLVMGGEFVVEDGSYTFTKKEVSKLYNIMLNDLVSVVEDGNEKDKKYALELIFGLIIQPMRLH